MAKDSPLIKSSKEIILLLLYAKGRTNQLYESIKGKTRLMKMVFLFKEELKKSFNKGSFINVNTLPVFTAYDFGPFSYEVYSDLDFLKTNEFIQIKELKEELVIPEEVYEYNYWISEGNIKIDEDTYTSEEYTLTDLGKEFTKTRLIDKLGDEQILILNEFKKRCTEISLRTLLKYVYNNYPKMITESKIREEVLKDYIN